MAFLWHTREPGLGDPSDPWSIWTMQRPVLPSEYWTLCEGVGAQRPSAFEQQHAEVPKVYAEQAPFFTVRTPMTVLQGGGASRPEFGGLGPVCSGNVGPAPALGLWAKALAVIMAPVELVLNMCRRAMQVVVPQADKVAVDRPVAPAPIDPPEAGQSAAPTIGIIDTDIAFLHQQFRRRDGAGTRILALWDQTAQLAAGPAAPWRTPRRFGYGREISQTDIDAKLGAAKFSELIAYTELIGSSVPAWGHGTQVLSLAGGLDDALRPAGPPDAAGDLEIVAVQLPKAAVEQTHGVWLNVLILDALHYLLETAPKDSPVVANISLGSHSGPHDGSSLLDRAIDRLIQDQRGRLSVVVAAGNAREAKAHASFTLPAGNAGSPAQQTLTIEMEGDDATPNFVEMWCRGAQTNMALACSCSFDDTPATNSGAIPDGPVRSRLLLSKAAMRDDHVVALLANPQASGGQRRAALFVGIGEARFARRDTWPAPAGVWTIVVENRSSDAVKVDAWLARDETIGDSLPEQYPKVFKDAPLSQTGTMSSLAWVGSAITVGGYRLGNDLKATGMWEHSGSAFTANDLDAGDPRRRKPDLCAPAASDLAFAAVPFHGAVPAVLLPPRPLEGTSLAAGAATRRIANVLAKKRSFLVKADLLRALQGQYPDTGAIRPTGQPEWTSDYWLPV